MWMNSKFSPLLTPFMRWSTSNYCSLNVVTGAAPSSVCWVYVIISSLSRVMPALRLVDRWVVLNHSTRSRPAQILFPHPELMLKNIRQNVGGSAVVREGRFEPSEAYALGSRPYMVRAVRFALSRYWRFSFCGLLAFGPACVLGQFDSPLL